MKRAVADTSALVSLALSGKLEAVLELIKVFVPEKVKSELEEISQFNDQKAKAAKKAVLLIKKQRICAMKVSDAKKALGLVNKNTDFGEAECVQLAIEQKISTLLMDDLNASYSMSAVAGASSISIKISAAAIVELARNGRISKKDAKRSLLQMIQNRGWEKTTLEYLIQKLFP